METERRGGDMVARYKTYIAICLMMLMSLTCLRIDNTSDLFDVSIASLEYSNSVASTEAEVISVNREYSSIETQDYINANASTRLFTSLYRRSQNHIRNYERNKVTMTVLDMISKVALFSFIMILFAASGTGLSMPFQCLLYYIHNMDGKKRIA